MLFTELVQADLCRPMQTKSHGDNYYLMLFTNDCTRYSWVYFLHTKSQAFQQFKVFRSFAEKQYGKPLMALRIDRAGEFTSKQFYSYCEEFGIKHQLTAQYTLEQNGVAEHKNRTLVEMARCLLKQRGLPTDL